MQLFPANTRCKTSSKTMHSMLSISMCKETIDKTQHTHTSLPMYMHKSTNQHDNTSPIRHRLKSFQNKQPQIIPHASMAFVPPPPKKNTICEKFLHRRNMMSRNEKIVIVDYDMPCVEKQAVCPRTRSSSTMRSGSATRILRSSGRFTLFYFLCRHEAYSVKCNA